MNIKALSTSFELSPNCHITIFDDGTLNIACAGRDYFETGAGQLSLTVEEVKALKELLGRIK